jgi:hypothetical protein
LLAQDAGEIPIGLYVFDKTPTCWLLPVLLGASIQFKQVIHVRATSQPGHQAVGSPRGTWAGLIPPRLAPQATHSQPKLFTGTAAVGTVALLTQFSTAPLPPPDSPARWLRSATPW